MKSLIVSIILALSVVGMSTASADDVTVRTTTNLSDAQKAELASQAAKMAAENATNSASGLPPTTKVEAVKQWVDIGTAIGSGLAASAKELGIAANDFAQTPVGRFTVFMIAFHFIGHTIIHLFFTAVWLVTCVSIFAWMYRRAAIARTVTYYEKDKGPNGARKVVTVQPKQIGENLGACIMVSVAVATLIFVVMLFNM